MTVGNAQGHQDDARLPVWAAESCMFTTLVPTRSGKYLTAGLTCECPSPWARGSRLGGESGAAGSAPLDFPHEVACASRERNVRGTFLPPGSRAHAGRPLRQRAGNWGSPTPSPTPHSRGWPMLPRGGGMRGFPRGVRVLHLDSQNCPRLTQVPRNFQGSLGFQPPRKC